VTPRDADSSRNEEIRERPLNALGGGLVLRVAVIAVIGAVVLLGLAIRTAAHGGHGGASLGLWIGVGVLAAAAGASLRGLTRLAPGEAVVVQIFGRYVGTLRKPGQWWVYPVANRLKVSTRLRTHETAVLKVNDTNGVPIEIAMAVSWRVSDTARALFAVEDYERYVRSQCERALRQVAAAHPYEPDGERGNSLSTSAATISDQLLTEVAGRIEPVGIAVVECQIVRIAYAPEIAQAMLRRQQAAAIVAARVHIVEGAVGMVELALQRLGDRHVVDLDEERKASMVSNLMVVLCSDHPTQPMVNAGSLYL
jgi:regulator of protease activity HflC (stomatin/prohibitin superfamily)